MNVKEQIAAYITSQAEPKRSDMQALHQLILQVMPACKLWFLDGKDEKGKIVSNPNIGYGSYIIKYADARPDGKGGRGTTREFYQIGLSANTSGISVYIMGIEDKKYLAQAYGEKLCYDIDYQFNPIEKIVELYQQKIELYERMLREKMSLFIS